MATRGPQAGPVIFRHTGLIGLIKKMQRLEAKMEDIDMAPAVRAAGKVWQDNFQNQGKSVGGWRPLSVYTQNVRQYRGFNPKYPILKQSGNLRTVAAEIPSKFKGKSTNRTVGGGYSGGPQTSLYIVSARNRATLLLTGDKVQNNYGGAVQGHGWQSNEEHRLPRRRFWFIDDEVRSEAAKAVVDTLKDDMGKIL